MAVTTNKLITKSAQRAQDILDQLVTLQDEMKELKSWNLKVDETAGHVDQARGWMATVHENLMALDASVD